MVPCNAPRNVAYTSTLFSFDRLEEIFLDLDEVDFDEIRLTYFLNGNQSIVKFTLLMCKTCVIEKRVLTEIVQSLPLLSELNFGGVHFSIDKFVDVIKESNLVKCGFRIENPNQFDDLKDRLGGQWRATINNDCVRVERNT